MGLTSQQRKERAEEKIRCANARCEAMVGRELFNKRDHMRRGEIPSVGGFMTFCQECRRTVEWGRGEEIETLSRAERVEGTGVCEDFETAISACSF